MASAKPITWQSLLTPSEKAAANGHAKPPRSAFAQQAGTISKEIQVTLERLQRLGALARSRSVFQDNSVEVVSSGAERRRKRFPLYACRSTLFFLLAQLDTVEIAMQKTLLHFHQVLNLWGSARSSRFLRFYRAKWRNWLDTGESW